MIMFRTCDEYLLLFSCKSILLSLSNGNTYIAIVIVVPFKPYI